MNILNKLKFVKSSFSGASGCVGVSINEESIYVTNTKNRKSIVKFTPEEWNAFVLGVKSNEFDYKFNKTVNKSL